MNWTKILLEINNLLNNKTIKIIIKNKIKIFIINWYFINSSKGEIKSDFSRTLEINVSTGLGSLSESIVFKASPLVFSFSF